MMTQQREEAASRLRIDGEMTIYRAAELKEVLLAALAQAAVLELDLSAVTEIDGAGVQLLMLADKTAQQAQRRLRVAEISPAVREVFALLDLANRFSGDTSGDERACPTISERRA